MGSLFWYVIAFICSQIVICVWVFTNISDLKGENLKLKADLGQRLFVRTPVGNWDLKVVLGALLAHLKLKLESTAGLKIIKDEYLRKKKYEDK